MVRQHERKGTRATREIPPHKSLEEMAREQGIDLDGPPPDYVALITAMLPTKRDIDEFDKHLAELRRKGAPLDNDD